MLLNVKCLSRLYGTSRLPLFFLLCLVLTGCAGGGSGSGGSSAGFSGGSQNSTISALQEFQNVSFFTSGGARLTNTIHPYNLAGVTGAYNYGLSGNGQTIAILDTGFNNSTSYSTGNAFAEMQSKRDAGKILFGSSLKESSSNHGNVVASLAAAGLDNQGSSYFENVTGARYPAFVGNSFEELNHGMHGVAYNATLHLSEFDAGGMSNYASATNRARSAGAVVQNNSWGLPSSPGNVNTTALTIPVSYNPSVATMTASAASSWLGENTPYSASEWQSYYSALKSFQSNGVVVFALLNQSASTRASLMAALPAIYPDLEGAWIAVGNVNVSGNTVTRRGAKCLEAAPYCLVADGTEVTGAGVQNSEGYSIGRTGTSFATPQISGMIALLAEAFPNLSPQDLTTRLLATANNRFFTPTATRTFAGGVSHDFNEEFGHGIPDVVAALQPLSTSNRPTGIVLLGSAMLGERIPLSETSLQVNGSMGRAIQAALSDKVLVAYDALGAGFRYPANAFVRGDTNASGNLSSSINKFPGYLASSGKKDSLASSRSNSASMQLNALEGEWRSFVSIGQSLSDISTFSTARERHTNGLSSTNVWAGHSHFGFLKSPLSFTFGVRPNSSSSLLAYSLNTRKPPRENHLLTTGFFDDGQMDNSIGLAYQRDFRGSSLYGSVMIGGQFEYDAVRGTSSSGALSLGQSTQSFYLAPKLNTYALGMQFQVGGAVAVSKAHGLEKYSSVIDSIGPLVTSEFYASAQKSDIFQDQDLAYLKVWQPEMIEQGRLSLNLPSLSSPYEQISLDRQTFSLKTPSRPVHISVGYSKPLSNSTEINYELFTFKNASVLSSESTTGGVLRLKKLF